jgi:hypothetical protein
MFRSQLSDTVASAEHDYVRHVWERSRHRWVQGLSTDGFKFGPFDYIGAALALLESMQRLGFDPDHAIPVDDNGDILNGAHRIACALALGKNVIIGRSGKNAWAPPWDGKWFLDSDFTREYVTGLRTDMAGLINGGGDTDSRRHAGAGEPPRKTA